MELARAHSTNGRAKNSPSSIAKLRQANTGIDLGDLNGKDGNTAIKLGEGQDRVEKVKALESPLAPLGE